MERAGGFYRPKRANAVGSLARFSGDNLVFSCPESETGKGQALL